jgi:hypothetical protein
MRDSPETSSGQAMWPVKINDKHMKKLVTIALLIFSLTAVAQEKIPVTESDYTNNSVEMADAMRAEGKIYVLVGIIAIVFAGITVYLINTDRKISKLEKNILS